MPNPQFVDIPFGAYAPDFGGMPRPEDPGYLVDAVELRATPTGYRANPTFTSFGVAVGTATPIGTCHFAETRAGLPEFLAIADTSSIYSSNDGSSWTARTGSGTDVTAQMIDWYDTSVSENVVIMATVNILQKRTVRAAANFATLSGTAYPTGGRPAGARCIARVRKHLVLGYINTGFDTGPFSLWWPAIGSISDWPAGGTADALAKESGSEEMNGAFGQIVRIIGGEKFGIVVQERALTRMTYVGGSAVWEFDTYEKKRGGGLISSVTGAWHAPFVEIGPGLWLWANEQGVHTTDGYSVKTLSPGQVEEALFTNTISHADSGMSIAARAVFDERKGQVIFKQDKGGSSNHHLVYNIRTNSFEIASGTTYHILFGGTSATAGDNTSVAYSLGTDRKLYKRTGSAGTIALQTGYIEPVPGKKVQLQGAHLLGAGVPGNLTLSYKATSSLGSIDVSQSGFTALTAPTRGMKSTGRATEQFFAFRVTGTGAESQLLKGIRLYFTEGEPAT